MLYSIPSIALAATTLSSLAHAAPLVAHQPSTSDIIEAAGDELTHKAVLDSQFVFVQNPNAEVQQANNELVGQGTSAEVVSGLQNLADDSPSMSPDEFSSVSAPRLHVTISPFPISLIVMDPHQRRKLSKGLRELYVNGGSV
jgi:hypothetical protein